MVRKILKKSTRKVKRLSRRHISSARSHIQSSAKYAHGHASTLTSKFREHVATALVAAFGFVIALSWRDVIKEGLEGATQAQFLANNPGLIPLYVAIITTAVAVVGILLTTTWLKKPEEDKK